MEYRLDLSTLLLMLKQSSGSLYTESQHLPGVKGRCQIFLHLEKGIISDCTITNERGDEIKGEAAIKLIQGQVLTWNYREEQPAPPPLPKENPIFPPTRDVRTAYNLRGAYNLHSTSPRQPSMPLRSPIPSRTYPPVSQSDFLVWPRLYRAVYSLVDGKASVDDIVRLLAREQTNEQVLAVISHLLREGLIVF